LHDLGPASISPQPGRLLCLARHTRGVADFYAANSNAFPIIIAPLTVGHNHGSEARNELDQYTLRPPWKQLGRILKADRLNCLGWMAVHLQRLQ
jgi:hypothetical protein